MRIHFIFLFLFIINNLTAQELQLQELGRYTDGREEALEIVSYDAITECLFITNGATDSIDIINISNPAKPKLVGHLDVLSYGSTANSVVVLSNGFLAAAVEAKNPQANGKVVFYSTKGQYINDLEVGAMPDMITVSPDKTKIVVANEGEPNDNYTINPEGSVSIIDISKDILNVSQADVTTLNFANAPEKIYGSIRQPNVSFQYDLEPEYVAINPASTVAAVSCQENNVIVFIDLNQKKIIKYAGLGFKSYKNQNIGLDASDKDDKINIQSFPVYGAYQPDAIASYSIDGKAYYVTANEGESVEYDGYSSETRVRKLKLDAKKFPNAKSLQKKSNLGRLKTFKSDVIGDSDGDGDVDTIYTYGGRSFSIWNEKGQLVFDSGDDFEKYIAKFHPQIFNWNEGNIDKKDKRSDDKGAEPEAVTIGQIGKETYAFIGLERQGGIMIYNITNPNAAYFVDYQHSLNETETTMKDLSPEGIIFISKKKNHLNKNLVVVANEFSGTATIYQVKRSFWHWLF
jgi:hypothetical protein